MHKEELRQALLAKISEQEWLALEENALPLNAFNRSVILQMRESKAPRDEAVPISAVRALHESLAAYLQQYMSECSQGHKWIELACIYLAYIKRIPMHPQVAAHWEKTADGYRCPMHAGADTLCSHCACKKA